jgi:hypothetical protein
MASAVAFRRRQADFFLDIHLRDPHRIAPSFLLPLSGAQESPAAVRQRRLRARQHYD